MMHAEKAEEQQANSHITAEGVDLVQDQDGLVHCPIAVSERSWGESYQVITDTLV
jgi:hypothetical protein